MTDVLVREGASVPDPGVRLDPVPDEAVARRVASRAVAGRRRPSTARLVLVGTIVGLAVLCRLFWVFNVHNPDGAALAWGSSLVAQGELDPYAATVEAGDADPVQPDQVHPLPLALGFGAVYAGAGVLAAGDLVGAIDLESDTEAQALRGPNPTIALYKLSYLVPELIVLGCLWSLLAGAARRAALVVLALNPLTFYAYGQGLPDLWQAAILVGALALVAAFQRSGRRRWAFAAVAVTILGAFAVKLMPLVVAAGVVAHLLRSPRFAARRDRVVLLLVTAAALAAGALPYLLNHHAWLSLTARFEIGMVLGSNTLSAVGNVAGSPLWLVVSIGVFAWLFLRPTQPPDALTTWVIASTAMLAFAAGGVQQFMLWGVVALLLLGSRFPLITAILLAGATAVTALSFVTFPWYDTLATAGLGLEAPLGSGPELLVGLPGSEGYGPAAAGLLLAGTALAVAVGLSGPGSRLAVHLGDRPRRWLAVVAGCCVLVLPAALLVGTGLKASHGTTSVALVDVLPDDRATFATAVDLTRPRRIEVPTSAVSTDGAEWPARAVTLLADPRTLPSTATVVVTLNAADGSTTTGAVPVAELEPLSGLGPVPVALDEPVVFPGGEVVIECVPATTSDAADCGDVWLDGQKDDEGHVVPSVTVRIGEEPGALATSAVRSLVRPVNAWIVLLSAASGLVIALAVRRRAAGQEDTPEPRVEAP